MVLLRFMRILQLCCWLVWEAKSAVRLLLLTEGLPIVAAGLTRLLPPVSEINSPGCCTYTSYS